MGGLEKTLNNFRDEKILRNLLVQSLVEKVEETDIGKQEKYKCAGKVFSLNRQPSVYG